MLPIRSALLLLSIAAASVRAQAPDDAVMMPRKTLSTGVMYAHASWDQYWEGTLKRGNANIGTLSTQSVMLVGYYGVNDRLTVAASLPYVWTRASAGSLHGMRGLQDLTFSAKYRLLRTALTEQGTLSALVVGAAGIPASGYTPDFLPLSIGLASRSVSTRFTLDFDSRQEWFITGSAAHTWRRNVTLDRDAYFTNGQLYLTNEVAMPSVVDYRLSTGFRKKRVYVPISLSQQRTLGGGDIRRQDMPFVSNRMDFVKLDGSVMYGLTIPTDLAVQVGASRTLQGRNVGQTTAFWAGVLHTLHF